MGRAEASRAIIIPILEQQYGCRTSGFRKALRQLVEDHVADAVLRDPAEFEGEDWNDFVDAEFSEWFGDVCFNPAAFRIDRDEPGRAHIHIWEIENAHRVPAWKLQAYGLMADAGDPFVTLHILDRYGHEAVTLGNELLECCAFEDNKARLTEIVNCGRAVKEPPRKQDPSLLTKGVRERAILRAVYESGLIKPGETL